MSTNGFIPTLLPRRSLILILISLFFITLVTITILGLSAATFSKVKHDLQYIPTNQTIPSTSSLVSAVQVDQAMKHLREFQKIADSSNGTRVVTSIGFNRTMQYIVDYLTLNTNLKVDQRLFYVRNFLLAKTPLLRSIINNYTTDYKFTEDLVDGDFVHAIYSGPMDFSETFDVIHVSNDGCSINDWNMFQSSLSDRVVLIKLNHKCLYVEQIALASRFNIKAILFYNDPTTFEGFFPNEVVVLQSNTLPILVLTYQAGQSMVAALSVDQNSVKIRIGIEIVDLPPLGVSNVCADTVTGDATKTIVIGSHSDGVRHGPGINDNASGSALNLVLAATLSKLLETKTYEKYAYRVRFCWWGAEEIDMLGSDHFVEEAKKSTVVGERLSDILVYLNFDMVGSPNFIFSIYDGDTIKESESSNAVKGSKKLTGLFRQWFEDESLPYNFTSVNIYTDHLAFLNAGIASGGLISGVTDIKGREERDYYASFTSHKISGVVGAAHDPCYHRLCDSIGNINSFSLEKMLQAGAFVLEQIARQTDLPSWLYPA